MANDKTYDRHVNIWINGREIENSGSAIRKEFVKLQQEVNKLTIGSKEYNEKAAEVKKLKQIYKEHQDNITSTGTAWSKLKGVFTGVQGLIVAGIAGVMAGYQSLKGVIESTDALGDKFTVTLAGWKGGMDALKRSIATLREGGLNDLGKKIREGIEEGRRYAESLDQIDEKTRALKMEEADAANQLLEQRKIQNDVRKSLEERNDAGKKAIRIEEDLAKIRTSIAYQGYQNESKNIASITHLTEDEILAYAKMDPIIRDKIEKGKQYNNLLIEQKDAAALVNNPQVTNEQVENYRRISAAIDNTSEEIKRFAFAAVNMPGDEKMQLFVDKYVAWQQAIGSATENTMRIQTKQASTEKQLTDQLLDELSKPIVEDLESGLEYDPEKSYTVTAEKILAAEKAINEQRVKNSEETEQARIDALIRAGEEGKRIAEENWANIIDSDRKNLEEQVMMYADFGDRIGTIVGNAIADGTISFKEGAKQIILFALDELGNYAQIAIVKATVGSLSSPESIASAGIAGVAKAAILTGLIKAAVATTKGIVSRNLSKQMYTGGYTGPGDKYQPVGFAHAGEWYANQDMVASPVTGPIIAALEDYRLRNYPGYVNGGPTEGTEIFTQGTGKGTSIFQSSPALENLIRNVGRLLAKIDKEGVRTVWGWKETDTAKKGMQKLSDIEDSVSF